MLKCRDVLALGSAALDDGLDGRTRLALRLHLMICGHCRRFLRSLRLTRDTVGELPLPAPDEARIRRILDALPPPERPS